MRALLRAVGSTVALVAIYYLLPLDRSATWAAVTMLAIGLTVLIGLVIVGAVSHGRQRRPRDAGTVQPNE